MALLEKYLIVKKSKIPKAGKGLFTKMLIPKNTLIVEYKGKVSSWKDANHDNGMNGYIYYVNRNYVIDALKSLKSLARYANDNKGPRGVKGLKNNADYVKEGARIYIKSTRIIPAGSEILVGYGKDYWDVISKNRESPGKKKKVI